LEEIVAAPVWKTENTAVRIRHSDYATPLYSQKLVRPSVGIVSLRSKATESVLIVCKRQKVGRFQDHTFSRGPTVL
jgi:hypothetical protein